LWAAAEADLEMVKTLVDNGAHILKPKKDGLTVMHLSAYIGDVRMLDFAIKVKETKSIDLKNSDVSGSRHLL
jgi:hypothetical protein